MEINNKTNGLELLIVVNTWLLIWVFLLNSYQNKILAIFLQGGNSATILSYSILFITIILIAPSVDVFAKILKLKWYDTLSPFLKKFALEFVFGVGTLILLITYFIKLITLGTFIVPIIGFLVSYGILKLRQKGLIKI